MTCSVTSPSNVIDKAKQAEIAESCQVGMAFSKKGITLSYNTKTQLYTVKDSETHTEKEILIAALSLGIFKYKALLFKYEKGSDKSFALSSREKAEKDFEDAKKRKLSGEGIFIKSYMSADISKDFFSASIVRSNTV